MPKLILVALRFAHPHRLILLAHREAYLRARGPAEVTWVVADEYVPLIATGDRVVALGASRPYSTLVRNLPSQLLRIRRLAVGDLFDDRDTSDDVHVLVVTSHPSHPALMKRIRQIFRGASIRYYLHEPTSLPEKVRRGVGLFMSSAVYATQTLELARSDMYYVASEHALRSSRGIYPIAGLARRGRVVPLMSPDLCGDFVPSEQRSDSPQVLMLGRADRGRCIDVFVESAAEAWQRGSTWKFAILSASSPPLPRWAAELPNVRFMIGEKYSDERMVAEVRRSRFVFNYFRNRYTQSGVTPVALMCGVPLIANDQERQIELAAAGCVFLDHTPTPRELVDVLESHSACNGGALRRYYTRTFHASSLRIPDVDERASLSGAA